MKISIILLTLLIFTWFADAANITVVSESDSHDSRTSLSSDTNLLLNLRVRKINLEIIPPSSGVQFYRKGIIFLSHSIKDEKVPERHLSFGSIRIYESIFEDTIIGNLTPFELISSELFPSEATTFSSDFKTMYLSLIPEKSGSEKIFRAQFTKDGWEIEDKPLPICNENNIYSHPCLSEDGSFLIFSSDMDGSKGGLDLWVTTKEGDRWGNPKNLGNQINSVGNELFASLDRWNNLYFSSDGHAGKGGYDIFCAKYNGSGWDRPINLPEIINSKDDELAYTINKLNNNTAFFTSRSRSGKYRTQLYLVDIINESSQKSGLSISESLIAGSGEEKTSDPSKNFLQAANMTEKKNEGDNSLPLTREDKTQEVQKEVPSVSKNIEPSKNTETKKELDSITRSQTAIPSQGSKTVQVTVPTPSANQSTEVKKDSVVYRIQITASTKPVGSQNIMVAGKIYKSFEYLYQGGYRTTVGEFSTLAEAIRLQSICRQNGYGQAFVVAFKNNIRSTDPNLFK